MSTPNDVAAAAAALVPYENKGKAGMVRRTTDVSFAIGSVELGKLGSATVLAALDAAIEDAVDDLAKKDKAVEAAQKAVAAAVKTLAPPPQLVAEVQQVERACAPFFESGTLTAKLPRVGQLEGIDHEARTFTVAVALVGNDRDRVFSATKTYPMPPAVATKVEALEKTKEDRDALVKRLAKLKSEKQTLPAKMQAFEAAAIRKQLVDSGAESTLASVDSVVSAYLSRLGIKPEPRTV